MAPKTHVHVFDVDGPLYSRDLDEDFAIYLGERGRFNQRGGTYFAQIMQDYKAGKIDYFTLCNKAVDAFAIGIKGKSTVQLLEDAHAFVQAKKPLFHTRSVEMLKRLQQNPHNKIALLSVSPDMVISAISKALGIHVDYVYGASYASRRGQFTGERITGDVQDYKASKLGIIARRFKVPLTQMTFYGNAVPDYESSKRAGVPFIMMNPSAALKKAVATDVARARTAAIRPRPKQLRRQRPIITRRKTK